MKSILSRTISAVKVVK